VELVVNLVVTSTSIRHLVALNSRVISVSVGIGSDSLTGPGSHVRSRLAGPIETISTKLAVITPEQPAQFIDYIGDGVVIVVAIAGAATSFSDCCGDCVVVALCKSIS
jgi:hypothetical protein